MAGIVFVLFLTYYGTKWLSSRANMTMGSRYMRIVDRMVLGRDRYLAIAEITGRFYLLSITENGTDIIRELEDFEEKPDEAKRGGGEFGHILGRLLKK